MRQQSGGPSHIEIMITFFHPHQLKHHPRTYLSRGRMREPQEVPERALKLLEAVTALGFEVHEPVDFGIDPIRAVHSAAYLAFLEEAHREWKLIPEDWGDEVMSNVFVREPNALRGILAQAACYQADGSCPIGGETWLSAYWSAQSAIGAATAVRDGAPHAYGLCRPPGHHARAEGAGGFCYLNTPAIAAEILRQKFGRVAVFDPDMHHGQGVQEIFYDRNDVLYASVHADPTNFYPAVTGHANERGAGAGVGCNLNLPMEHGASEAHFFEQVDTAIAAVTAFKAEALVVALGFDVYKDDPQSKVAVTTEGFARLGEHIGRLGLPTVIVQEGGYHIDSLSANANAFFTGFAKGHAAA